MNRHETDVQEAEVVERVTLGRVARTFKAYRAPILLSLAAVFCGYLIVAAILMLRSSSLTVTTLPFRLQFAGAEAGRYPNGMPFSPTEIVAQPVLAQVWEANELRRFMPLGVFTRSVYVVEANPAMERLMRDYRARLADAKLGPIDRERLVREFETKKDSISKNEYSLNFSAARESHRLPDALTKKVLTDVLREWAARATREQRVLQYGIAVLSPNIVPPAGGPGASLNYIARLQMLRGNIYRVIANLNLIEELPGGKLIRTRTDQLTLNDVRAKLEDIVRFRLEPLVPAIRSSGLANLTEALRFSEMQLQYDERQLAYARDRAQVIRQAILTYANANASEAGSPDGTAPAGDQPPQPSRQAGGDSVTPQLTDTFLDRLMSMTSATKDVEYRQQLIDDYREMAQQMPPLQQAVTYDREVIEQLRSATAGSSTVSAEQVDAQINAMQREVHESLKQMNELYDSISRNLAPETHMYTTTAVSTTRTERRVASTKLAALGILVLFLAFPIILADVLIHNRMRQEDEIDDRAQTAAATVQA